MKSILYATDYSKNSVAALKFAYHLAIKLNSKLTVLHVFDVPLSLASPVSVSYMKKEKRLFVEHRAKLKAFCKEHLGDSLNGKGITFLVDENNSIPDSIMEKSLKFDVDLIVVGTKGESRVKEFFLGSTPKALILKSSCPVLAIPEKSDNLVLRRIVYATDFEQADIFAINRLVAIAKKFDAEIRVVHITTTDEYAGDQQMEWFKDMLRQKVKYPKLEFHLLLSDDIYRELIGYLEDSKSHMLVMLERKESTFYQKYFKTDMVKKMVKSIKVPLLSFNERGL